MRRKYFVSAAILFGAVVLAEVPDLAAQEIATEGFGIQEISVQGVAAGEFAVVQAPQLIGPLYAYGPSTAAPQRRYRQSYGRPYAPRYDKRNSQRYDGDGDRYYPRYGNRNSQQYSGNGERYYPRYDNRKNYAQPYRYGRSRYPRWSDQDRYAARIVIPGQSGRWRDLGPVHQMPID